MDRADRRYFNCQLRRPYKGSRELAHGHILGDAFQTKAPMEAAVAGSPDSFTEALLIGCRNALFTWR